MDGSRTTTTQNQRNNATHLLMNSQEFMGCLYYFMIFSKTLLYILCLRLVLYNTDKQWTDIQAVRHSFGKSVSGSIVVTNIQLA